MEWFHCAAQHNHKVISSFWLLCKTSEKKMAWRDSTEKEISRFYLARQSVCSNQTTGISSEQKCKAIFNLICAIKFAKNGRGRGRAVKRTELMFLWWETIISPTKLGGGKWHKAIKEKATEDASRLSLLQLYRDWFKMENTGKTPSLLVNTSMVLLDICYLTVSPLSNRNQTTINYAKMRQATRIQTNMRWQHCSKP